MNSKTLALFLILSALIAVLLYLDTDKTLDNSLAREQRIKDSAAMVYAQAQVEHKQNNKWHQARQDSLQALLKVKDLVIKRLSHAALKAQVKALPEIDSVERIVFVRYDSAVAERDTTIALKDAEVIDLRQQVHENDSLCTVENAALQTQLNASNDQVDILNKQIRNLRRNRRWERIGEGAILVGIIALIL